MLPNDFYKMRYTDYILLQTGFFNKRKHEQRLLRKAVAKLLEPYAAKGKSIDEYRIWPVPGDDVLKAEEKRMREEMQIEVSEQSMKILEAFKAKEREQSAKDN